MTDPSNESDAEEPPEGHRPVWALSRDDQRTLWITFVGGLGSIVVGAAAIGGAIALAHHLTGPERPHGSYVPLLRLTGAALAVFALSIVLLLIVRWRNRTFKPDRGDHALLVAGVATIWLTGLFCAFLLLVWTGVAAGIK